MENDLDAKMSTSGRNLNAALANYSNTLLGGHTIAIVRFCFSGPSA